ncbi:MAG: RnfABCDGE type electron transport complex subunit D [Pseudomonadota bacterium]
MRTFDVADAPHVPAPTSVRRVMGDVLIALVPGAVAHVWFFGPAVLVQLALATLVASVFEALLLWLRGRPVAPFLGDLSAPVTAALFVLCLPPLLPWWYTVIGMLFAIVIAKHLFGGLGHNVFNPAMIGYAAVLISFPLAASSWLPPRELADGVLTLPQALAAIFTGALPAELSWDAVTGATPLDRIRSGVIAGEMISELRGDPIFGDFGGKGWEWIANAYGLGGIYLLWRRVISWHVPVAMLGTVIVLTLPGAVLDPDTNPFPLAHVFTGGMVLGAFFIATDPVSGATTPRGRLVFGAGVAVLTLVIRRWGGYPDGVAFAVLLMNMTVPLLDRYTRPRVFGRGR